MSDESEWDYWIDKIAVVAALGVELERLARVEQALCDLVWLLDGQTEPLSPSEWIGELDKAKAALSPVFQGPEETGG